MWNAFALFPELSTEKKRILLIAAWKKTVLVAKHKSLKHYENHLLLIWKRITTLVKIKNF